MLEQWAKSHNISPEALEDLRAIFCSIPTHIPQAAGASETHVQSLIRLEAATKGNIRLWRNNNGVLTNPETGRPVRFGLANDSKEVNKKLKSGDLIGWRTIEITPEHVGRRIAQFLSREIKHGDWKYSGTERERAQLKWAELVMAEGGDACFASGEGSL